tara:strand:- start:33576 stop:33827 length:252 start_codon:yes stop_codon:yes gene_type:complete
MKTKLVHELRYGMLLLKIKRASNNRTSIHVVSIHRLYRNGELWHESTRFGQDDIPSMRYLLDEAHSWMLSQTEENAGGNGERQ